MTRFGVALVLPSLDELAVNPYAMTDSISAAVWNAVPIPGRTEEDWLRFRDNARRLADQHQERQTARWWPE